MADKKIYSKLPAVHQTTALKNFFESTVEQLFSKANTESIQGYIGSPRTDDVGVSGQYIKEPTATKRFYGLSPTVNTINDTSGESQDLIYYDEMIDTLKTYGVDVRNHNKIFSENFSTYLPPINIDKLVNYAEYYWVPAGPTTIDVMGTVDTPVDIESDIIGQPNFTPPGGIPFRNGMIVRFSGVYIIPLARYDGDFIVDGVGDSIILLPKRDNYSTRFTTTDEVDYDNYEFVLAEEADDSYKNTRFSAGDVDDIRIISSGVGYVDPQILVYDNAATTDATALAAYPDLVQSTVDFEDYLPLNLVVKEESENLDTGEYNTIFSFVDTYRTGGLANVSIDTVNSAGGITEVSLETNGSNYVGGVTVVVYDKEVVRSANVSATLVPGNVTNEIVLTSSVDISDIKPGQLITGPFTAIVDDVNELTATITLDRSVIANAGNLATDMTFKGRGFKAEALRGDVSASSPTGDQIEILESQARIGVNPNNPHDYYFIGGTRAWDADFDGDNIGDSPWAALLTQSNPDYLLQQRGAVNKNVWSRVNFWYHRDNFIDAGDEIPGNEFRAQRPIIEFSKDLELYNHAENTIGAVTVAITTHSIEDLQGSAPSTIVDGVPIGGSTIIFPSEESGVNQYIYTAQLNELTSTLDLVRVGDPINNPIGAVDGEISFVPYTVPENYSAQIISGEYNIGKEYIYTGTEWTLAQEKININQAPLFTLYDLDGVVLDDPTVYPNSTFAGNKIFSYATETGNDTDLILSTVDDSVLGFPLVYQQFKSSSEFVFKNYQQTEQYNYRLVTSTDTTDIDGYYLYNLDNNYHAIWRSVETPSEQRVITTYRLTQVDIDVDRKLFSIGCEPKRNPDLNSGYDIQVTVNSDERTDFTYGNSYPTFIDFDSANFSAGDFIEISVATDVGLLTLDSSSKYELPLSWGHNPLNEHLDTVSEPVYIDHFANYMQNQLSFIGEPLNGNNFDNTEKDLKHATQIVSTDQTTLLGAFLVDDQPHNLVDALRFTAQEYIKFKNRFRSELTKHYQMAFNSTMSNEQTLEQVLRQLISFKVGREVFNRTYVVPFGDNYTEEQYIIAVGQDTVELSMYADLNKIENSLLIYRNDNLMCIDRCYRITSFNPITIEIQPSVPLQTGDVITAKLYDAERDSAQCPPTPSTMGITPLHQPEITLDSTFQTPIEVLIGHDGSKTATYGDERDQIMLDFERRIYNSAKSEFRAENSILEYNPLSIRSGAFRNTGYSYTEWYDLLRHHFSLWTTSNNVDPVVNEFFDPANEWTWNYGDGTLPGHWRGLYEYYYDTDRPHTHPWEMLGFTEKPLWWDEQYGTDYSSNNSSMWTDLEDGIIRQGERANTTTYLTNNDFRRIGLRNVIPVDETGELITPYRLFSTDTTTKTISWDNQQSVDLDTISVTESGAGYSQTPTVTITGGGGTGATATATTAGGNVVAVAFTSVGQDYTSEPTVTIEAPGVQEITLIDGGTGYDPLSPPTVTIEESETGYTATAEAIITNDTVTAITITSAGFGYSSTPRVSIAPPVSGDPAIATAVVYTRALATANFDIVHEPTHEYRTASFLNIDGINVSYDDDYVYVTSRALVNHPLPVETDELTGHTELYGNPIDEQDISFAIPKVDLAMVPTPANNYPMAKNKAVAVTVNGLPIYNNDYGRTWEDGGEWTFNHAMLESDFDLAYFEAHNDGLFHYHILTPELLGQDSWDVFKTNSLGEQQYIQLDADGSVVYTYDNEGIITGVDYTTDPESNVHGGGTQVAYAHSPIVGWAFDGLPIYGPYGYANSKLSTNLTPIDPLIVKINSPWTLRPGTRTSGPGGAHTGKFIEDYQLQTSLAGKRLYADAYNSRNGATIDSDTAIRHYVVTLDANDSPSFPYHVGGGANVDNVWKGNYYAAPTAVGEIGSITITDQGGLYTAANTTITISGDGATTATVSNIVIVDGKIISAEIDNPGSGYTEATAIITGDGVRAKATVNISTESNALSNATVNTDAIATYVSESMVVLNASDDISKHWQFGDSSPVEYVWKRSEGYMYAVAEALLLAKPGRFATVFSDPTKIYNPTANKNLLLSTVTKQKWDFTDTAQFEIHGDINASGNFITNVGYTQFVNSWLAFQGLDTTVDFADKLRTLNFKLSHRMSGYVDRDTMTVRTDQYSNDGKATSLIIPKENTQVTTHSSNYKSRNVYSGVIVEKTANGYRVKGYDHGRNYFEVLRSDTNGPRERVEVGGTPASYIEWEPNTTYRKGTIVEYLNGFYQASVTISSGTEFDKTIWVRLAKLPQENAASGTLYQKSTTIVDRVNYETEMTTVQEVYNFLISLGKYQQQRGYDFGDYSTDIAAVSDWAYSAKQFLFWTTGKWEIGNTLELSPMSQAVKFVAPRGFIAKINRSDREQFSIVDQEGAVISPSECSIQREDDTIVVKPPEGTQIYGVVLFVKEMEHALVLDNVTSFNDIIYNPVIFQKHSRLKVKAARTLAWTGKMLSEGFIINGDELLPNLDNLAESMGRYHELGFIPVEKQVYDTSRALYGYTEREYLRDLDILDEQQFDFYKGMIQNKGTGESLTRIAKSSAVVQGEITVYDEWALKVGEFGDTENDQSLELSLVKSNLISDPQLITTQTPQSITYGVTSIDVIDPRYSYITDPQIIISQPALGGTRAVATAVIDRRDTITNDDGETVTNPNKNKLSSVTINDSGSGYSTDGVRIATIAANVFSDARATVLSQGYSERTAQVTGYANTTILIDHISNTSIEIADGNSNVNISLVAETINSNAEVNTNVIASVLQSTDIVGNTLVTTDHIALKGVDFTVQNGNIIGVVDKRYRPRQRFQLQTIENVTDANLYTNNDVFLYVDGVLVEREDANSNVLWEFNPGNVLTASVGINPSSTNITLDLVGGTIDSDNLVINQFGNYNFIDVFIDDVKIDNRLESQLYTITNNTITFTQINKLPAEVLRRYTVAINEDNQTKPTAYGLTSASKIKIVELGAIEFTENFTQDVPGAEIAGVVAVKEGIVAKVSPIRTYAIEDVVSPTAITFDVDDADRFVKKPTGELGASVWPTTTMVDYTGITDTSYPTIRNAGYVRPEDVNFRAFDLASLPDLYSSDIKITPSTNDYVHIAVSENNDWNVYKLTNIGATQQYLYRGDGGTVNLLTNKSLFNFLDTNQILEPNTGKYLDYYLSLENSAISDKVVLWKNEEIVQAKQYAVSEFKAPRMVQARIASIGPRNLTAISNVTPTAGQRYGSLEITNVDDSTGLQVITIQGNNFTQIAANDKVRLVDNIGVSSQYDANLVTSGTNVTFNTRNVSNVQINDGGTGYELVPTVIFSAGEVTATGIATVTGNIAGVTVVDDGTAQGSNITTPAVTFTNGGGTGATAQASITNANIVGYEITVAGTGYATAPAVTISGGGSGASATAILDDNGNVTGIVPDDFGSGYDMSNTTVTIANTLTGIQATAVPVLRGNVAVTITQAGTGYTSVPAVTVESDAVQEATAVLDATVTGVTITDNGAGYTGNATITFDGANSSPASANVNMDTGVTELNELFVAKGTGNVFVTVTGEANSNLAFSFTELTNAEQDTLDAVNEVFVTQYPVTAVDAVNGAFTITDADDVFSNARIISNITDPGYAVTTYQEFNADTSNVITATPTTLTIDYTGNTTIAPSIGISLLHYNKSNLECINHSFNVGDTVRINSNMFSGMFGIQSIGANSIVISAPYVDGFESGNIIQEGVEITTTSPHSISSMYAKYGKRIAVHFAEPLYYNKVYPVSQVTPDKIVVSGYWPADDTTHVYYEERSGTVNASSVYPANSTLANATNIIRVTESTRLNDFVATYAANGMIISPTHVTFNGNVAIIAPTALPANSSVKVDIIRQVLRSNERYPTLTTVDHNKATINGSKIEVDSYNNPQAVASSINRNIQLREQFTTTDKGKFGLRIPMLKNPNISVTDSGQSASEISDYGAYIRDPLLIEKLSNGKLKAQGDMNMGSEDELRVDTNFKKDDVYIGPTAGLTKADPVTGVTSVWSPSTNSYRPLVSEFGDSSTSLDANLSDTDLTTNAYDVPEYHIDSNDTDSDLILVSIPGTGSAIASTRPGTKRSYYDMTLLSSYTNSAGANYSRYRLLPNAFNMFMVYEIVKNDQDDLYYILVDKSTPPAMPHDFYGTINSYSDFDGLSITNYYYDNNILPEVDGSNIITDLRDPNRSNTLNGKVLSLSEVEPAAYMGKQLVAEPFATANNTDAEQNILSLPPLSVSSPAAGKLANINVDSPGYNRFLLWTPGLTPGKWKPQSRGPGAIDGTSIGFGSGYSAVGDSYPDDYPEVSGYDYATSIPRLAYSRLYSVIPKFVNYETLIYTAEDGTQYTQAEVDAVVNAGGTTINGIIIDDMEQTLAAPEFTDAPDDDTDDAGMRADKVWVACFWTEPYVYENQLVEFDYSAVDASGLPTPIYRDYNGTVVRFKYIRLTELPENAVTQRLIPDTGWGGKQWTNRRTDTVNLTPQREDDIWDLFDPTTVSSGSTGDATETSTNAINVGTIGTATPNTTGASGATVGLDGTLVSNRASQDKVPVSELGPILSGAFLEGLAGPCVEPSDPGLPAFAKPTTDCTSKILEKRYDAHTNLSTEFTDANNSSHPYGYFEKRIVGVNDVRVWFNVPQTSRPYAFAVVQSFRPYSSASNKASWWNESVLLAGPLLGTKFSGNTRQTDGSQIGIYGTTAYDKAASQLLNDTVTSKLGLSTADVKNNKQIYLIDSDGTEFESVPLWGTSTDAHVKGIGFLTEFDVRCTDGEYITVFAMQGSTPMPIKDEYQFDIVIEYGGEQTAEDVAIVENACEYEDSGSRTYQQGAILKEWSSKRDDGFFGQHDDNGEYDKPERNNVDNIYFPYNRPDVLRSWFRKDDRSTGGTTPPKLANNSIPYSKSALSTTVQFKGQRYIQNFPRTEITTNTTIEIKGYFQAPVTGVYEFSADADDSAWMWISSTYEGDRNINEFTNGIGGKAMYRMGVNDLGKVAVNPAITDPYGNQRDGFQTVEHFVNDGMSYDNNLDHKVVSGAGGFLEFDSEEYAYSTEYHRDNCVLRTGWLTTEARARQYGINNGRQKQYERRVFVELKAGEFYFVRILTGNKSGPGYVDLKYHVVNSTTSSNSSGYLSFGGRWCDPDNPPAGDAQAPTVPPTDGGGRNTSIPISSDNVTADGTVSKGYYIELTKPNDIDHKVYAKRYEIDAQTKKRTVIQIGSFIWGQNDVRWDIDDWPAQWQHCYDATCNLIGSECTGDTLDLLAEVYKLVPKQDIAEVWLEHNVDVYGWIKIDPHTPRYGDTFYASPSYHGNVPAAVTGEPTSVVVEPVVNDVPAAINIITDSEGETVTSNDAPLPNIGEPSRDPNVPEAGTVIRRYCETVETTGSQMINTGILITEYADGLGGVTIGRTVNTGECPIPTSPISTGGGTGGGGISDDDRSGGTKFGSLDQY